MMMKKPNEDISQLHYIIEKSLVDPTHLSNSDKLTKFIVAKALLYWVENEGDSRDMVSDIAGTLTYQHFIHIESLFPNKFPGYVRLECRTHEKEETHFKQAIMCLNHRLYAREKYYLKAFASGKDVLYLSIMSQDTMNTMGERLKESFIAGTKLRVLTWHIDVSPNIIEAFRMHLGENTHNPKLTLKQVQDAAKSWDIFEKQYPNNLEVRNYWCTPTMQAVIVKNQWALVELLPYNLKKNDRPALLLTPNKQPALFELFVQQFEQMWTDWEKPS